MLCDGNVVIVKSTQNISGELTGYREIQEKQITSVEELCLDVGRIFDTTSEDLSLINVTFVFMKENHSENFNNTRKEICYKPLLLISGKIFDADGRSIEEKAKDLLENGDGGTMKVKSGTFDEVRW